MISIKFEKYSTTKNTHIPISKAIKDYYNYVVCQEFDDLICPNCGQQGCLHHHKTYSRNISYKESITLNNIEICEMIDTTIDIEVVVCERCLKENSKQKYHALLPDFISPYHIYSTQIIILSVYSLEVSKATIKKIAENLHTTHKQIYDWKRKFIKYLLPASIVLKINKDMQKAIKMIHIANKRFLSEFYQHYNHPYFLFKRTCVPLCITP